MFIVATIPGVDTPTTYGPILDHIELTSVIIFTIEFVLRVYCCVEHKKYGKLGPIKGRLRYMVTFLGIIDLLAIGPYWISLLIRKDLEVGFIAAVRIFRLARLFKVEKYTHAITIMLSVVKNNREVLFTTLFMGLLLFIITSTALYYVEKDSSSGHFNSIPATLYICTLMITGQGVPDSATLSLGGKWVVAITCIFSIAVFAVPTAILGWGFESVGEKFIEKRKIQKKLRKKKKREEIEQLRSSGIEVDSRSESTDEFSLNLSSDSSSEDEGNSPIVEVIHAQACPHCKRAYLPTLEKEKNEGS